MTGTALPEPGTIKADPRQDFQHAWTLRHGRAPFALPHCDQPILHGRTMPNEASTWTETDRQLPIIHIASSYFGPGSAPNVAHVHSAAGSRPPAQGATPTSDSPASSRSASPPCGATYRSDNHPCGDSEQSGRRHATDPPAAFAALDGSPAPIDRSPTCLHALREAPAPQRVRARHRRRRRPALTGGDVTNFVDVGYPTPPPAMLSTLAVVVSLRSALRALLHLFRCPSGWRPGMRD